MPCGCRSGKETSCSLGIFEVTKNLGRKLDAQGDCPFRLVDVLLHEKSGWVQELVTGQIEKARKGGVGVRTHVNNMKLFYARGSGLPDDTNHITVNEVPTAVYWEPGEVNGGSLGGGLARCQALVF